MLSSPASPNLIPSKLSKFINNCRLSYSMMLVYRLQFTDIQRHPHFIQSNVFDWYPFSSSFSFSQKYYFLEIIKNMKPMISKTYFDPKMLPPTSSIMKVIADKQPEGKNKHRNPRFLRQCSFKQTQKSPRKQINELFGSGFSFAKRWTFSSCLYKTNVWPGKIIRLFC